MAAAITIPAQTIIIGFVKAQQAPACCAPYVA
jgi:hypothetical protein